MSGDGPSKAAPEAEPLDDIILGDDDATEVSPQAVVAAPKPSQPPPLRASARPPDRASAPPPLAPPSRTKKDTSSNRVKAAREQEVGKDPRESQGRKRAKMTLRIPDDEISRPNLPATTPAGGIPALGPPPQITRPRAQSSPDEPTMPLVRPLTGPPPNNYGRVGGGGPDDTLELPGDEVRARLAAITNDTGRETGRQQMPSAPAVGIDPSQESGWTPFQPEVERDAMMPPAALGPGIPETLAEEAARHEAARQARNAAARERRASESDHLSPLSPRNGGGTVLDEHEVHNSVPVMIADSVPPVSEDIPVDMDLDTESLSNLASSDGSNDDVPTNPRLPLDSEEIRIDEALSVDRISETGEVEVSAEDLVSVESLPAPGHAPPPLKTAGKYPAFKDDTTPEPQAATPTPITASALMQGVAPSPSPSRPAMQAVHVPIATNPNAPSTPPPAPVVATTPHAPSVIASPVAQVPPVAMAAPPPAAAPSPMPMHPQGGMAAVTGGMAARRQSNPLIFVPPVGGLAPPPMTDTAAHRKKTRPWWEELFNDDFIRTMAKVTDAQIGKEVNFIEESLGCEAGAMILDLACGTGRHAVELAARGYQVVGFDLSLAMLARASDEAQDRKQKINFVQGDMREMTFEETFDGVYSWNTSFGYFDEEKNGAVIARVHKSLKKGGQFLLDVVNRDYIVRQAPSLAWFEGDGCICMDEMTIDFITSRMKVKRTLMMDDGRTKEIEYSVRVYALHELGKMLHDNGFRVAEVSGRTGTPGVFFGCESPRTLILAEKR